MLASLAAFQLVGQSACQPKMVFDFIAWEPSFFAWDGASPLAKKLKAGG